MAERTGIEWTGSTWTPIRARHRETGKLGWHCVHASEGCRHCYAETMNGRLGTGLPFKPGHAREIEIVLDERMLLQPLRWKAPRPIFVCSMTDLFADFVSDAMIDRVFAVMGLAAQHTHQVLTKRPERMRAYVSNPATRERIALAAADIVNRNPTLRIAPQPWFVRLGGNDHVVMPWPLPNVWKGVSAEHQAAAGQRVPELLATPAAIRFVSAEPLLGPIDFRHFRCDETFSPDSDPHNDLDALTGEVSNLAVPYVERRAKLDWIIVGGESGPNARPMHPDWARSIRDQCAAAGTAFFFKQWGEWFAEGQQAPGPIGHIDLYKRRWCHAEDGHDRYSRESAAVHPIGKKRAGRLLDGVNHSAMPEARS